MKDLVMTIHSEDALNARSVDQAHQNDNDPKVTIVEQLDEEAQRKFKVLELLIEPCDRTLYGTKLREASEQLGCSIRTVQRMVKRWEIEGVSTLVSSGRADQGKHRISEFWQNFIVKTYEAGNKDSKRMKPKQVALRVQAKAFELGDENPPSYKTVLRMLKPIIERKEKSKSIRSPGWRGSTLSIKTREGQDLEINYSNQVWQCDHTPVDVLLVDQFGKLLGRPWLTTVIDTYSRCIMGINLGFDAPSSQVVALALRHAILPKRYGPEHTLNCEWSTFGKPEHFYTDGGKDFRSNHLKLIGADLGFVCHLRDRPSEGGVVERPFRTLNDQLFSTLQGYTGSNVQERPDDAEKNASLTLRDLECLVVRFICDQYNQTLDARMGDQTRLQRWEAGLLRAPEILEERYLDVCLMKVGRRTVQRGGYLQFENLMFRGDYLAGYAGETVSIRFDPNDITKVLIYLQRGEQEEFLTRAFAQGLETEQLSYEEAKAGSKRLRASGKSISNESILQEVLERDALVAKKSRKQIQKAEQLLAKPKASVTPEPVDTEPINDGQDVEAILDNNAFDPIDFDDIQGAW